MGYLILLLYKIIYTENDSGNTFGKIRQGFEERDIYGRYYEVSQDF